MPASAVANLRGAATATLITVLLAACMAPPRPNQPRYEPPTVVATGVTFADAAIAPDDELQLLAGIDTAPAALRRAWLHLQQQRADQALDAVALVLYGPNRASAHDEAFARYLRAEAFRVQGHPERGQLDLQRARELALDPALKRLLGPEMPDDAEAASPWSALAVLPRSTWGPLNENRGELNQMTTPSKVTIHHSAMYFRDTRPRAAAAQIARIQREHMHNRNYGDIGYHFLIDPSGRIWEGRRMRWQGAHASGDNNIGNIGICLLGNFVRQARGADGPGQGPTRAQVQAMQQLVVQLMRHYRIDNGALFCHSDFKPTACPGPRMAPLVKQFADRLRAAGSLAAAEEE